MGKRIRTFLWGFGFAWKLNKKLLIFCFGLNGLLALFPALILHYNQKIIAGLAGFPAFRETSFAPMAGMIVVLGLLMTASGLSQRMNRDFLYMVMYDSYYLGMQEILMDKIQRIPYKALKQQKNQEEYLAVIHRAGSLTDVLSAVCVLFGELVTAGSLLAVVVRQSLWCFVLILAYLLLSVGISSKFIEKQRVNMQSVRRNERIADYFQKLPLNLGVAKEIRIYDTCDDILNQWEHAYEGISRQERNFAFGKEKQGFFHGLGLNIFLLILCTYQLVLVSHGNMTADVFLTFFLLCQNLSKTVRDITGSMIGLDYGLFSLERQKAFLENMPEAEARKEMPEAEARKEMPEAEEMEAMKEPAEDASFAEGGHKEPMVELRNVSFSYDSPPPAGMPLENAEPIEKRTLKNINFRIKKGEIVALLGGGGRMEAEKAPCQR